MNELVTWLREQAECAEGDGCPQEAAKLRECALIIAGAGPSTAYAHSVHVDIDPSEVDNVPVVQIDTTGLGEDAQGPLCRIYLNDHCLYENPPFPSELAESLLESE